MPSLHSVSYLNLDTSPPVLLSCPDDIIVIADLGTKSKIVNWTEPVYSDNSGGVPTVEQQTGFSSGYKFVEGVHSVQYTATDFTGNVNYECAFKIQVRGKYQIVIVIDFCNLAV